MPDGDPSTQAFLTTLPSTASTSTSTSNGLFRCCSLIGDDLGCSGRMAGSRLGVGARGAFFPGDLRFAGEEEGLFASRGARARRTGEAIACLCLCVVLLFCWRCEWARRERERG